MKAIMRDGQEMKYSGIEWIGEVPSTWRVCKTLYGLSMPITDGPHTTPELYAEGVPFVSAEAVSTGNGSIDFSHIRGYVSEEFYQECSKKYIPQREDIYMIKSGATTGKVSIVDTDRKFTIWSPLAVFRVNNERIISKYLFYYIQSEAYQKQVELNWSYGTQQNIGMRVLEQLKICMPILDEQKNIANYLDDRCSKIDAIIAEAKASIEEYKELKQAVIYEAVTKGLDKNVELKDSGIEWIGEIPESWDIKKIKYVAEFNPKITVEYDTDKPIGYVPMDAVKFGYMEPLEHDIDTLSTGLTQFQEKDIIMAKVTPCFENGEIAIAENLAQGIGFGSSELFVYRVKSINRRYLFYYLQHIGFKGRAAATMTGVGGLKRISSYFANNAEVTYPSLDEQKIIVEYLDKYCEGIRSLISEKQSLMEDLESYKKSLIYEVVTGKRKVVE